MKGILITIAVLCAVAIGFGFYFDWLNLSTARDRENDQVTVKLDVNQSKAKDDLNKAKEKVAETAKETGKKANEVVKTISDQVTGSEAIQGKLTEINKITGQITVENADGTATTISTNEKTQVKRGDTPIELRDLQTDEQVMVQYRMEKETRIAQTIRVEPK